VIAAAWLGGRILRQNPPSGGDPSSLDVLATNLLAQQHIPGLSVAIVQEGRIVFSRAYGFSDLENIVNETPASKMRTASIAKPMTAIAAMQLAEQGRLELDAPVQKYCPAFPYKKSPSGKDWPVTTRELLSHRAGVRWYANDVEGRNAKHFDDLNSAIAVFGNDPLLFEPDTDFRYSSYGYVVVGCAIEGASHLKFAEYMRQAVFRPSGMNATEADDPRKIIPLRAHTYEKSKAGEVENAPFFDPSDRLPGGGWLSTSQDLVRFADAVMSGKLVSQQTLQLMWKPLSTEPDETAYGLGWTISNVGTDKVAGHTGGQVGTSTVLLLAPEKHLAVAAMANIEGADLTSFARTILQLYADQPTRR
jgi:CubicO group peptidase (beta-lactamase class C family)